MELSQDLVGKYVSVQLGRPLYVNDYHCTILQASSRAVLGYVMQPQMVPGTEPQEPVLMDLFVGVKITKITPTSVTFEYITPLLHVVERTVPAGLIVFVDRLTQYGPQDLPLMDKQVQRRIVAP